MPDHPQTPDQPRAGGHGAGGLLAWIFAGLAFLLNAALVRWVYPDNPGVAPLSALAGALLLMAPVLAMAWRDLRRGELHMSALVALAVLAAFVRGEYPTAGWVSLFMLLALAVESRAAAGAHAAIEALIRLAPERAVRVDAAGVETPVRAADLALGDRIRVRPGDTLPADGIIREGQTTLNEATITGESFPVDKGPGAQVFAGTDNLTGSVLVVVNRAGADTTLGRVRDLILQAERSRLPLARIMDRYIAYYVPAVAMVAVLVWVATGDLDRVISLLVVACPCGLVLAAPSAMVAGLAAAARRGILVRDVAVLEQAADLDAFVFDKTGTVTAGCLRVARLAPGPGVAASDLVQAAVSAGKYSPHPILQALLRLAGDVGVAPLEPEDFRESPGRGVQARVAGRPVQVGREAWLREQGVEVPAWTEDQRREQACFSIVCVARDGRLLGWIGLDDQVRDGAAACFADLARLGVRRLALVTGDREPAARQAAQAVGCGEVQAQLLPEGKADFVRSVRAQGFRVAVVGDGINDAPALATGDVGIAMGAAGSQAAIHSAAVALMNNDLRRLPFLVRLARRTRAVVWQNIGLGMLLMLGGLGLAGAGFLGPVAAALLHNAGSLFVVFNSARLVRDVRPE
jgi:Cd2+/Zn2+-exporting ATPase